MKHPSITPRNEAVQHRVEAVADLSGEPMLSVGRTGGPACNPAAQLNAAFGGLLGAPGCRCFLLLVRSLVHRPFLSRPTEGRSCALPVTSHFG
jgi:hypothetical protein